MSYLLDKKEKRKKYAYGLFLVAILLILFYFRTGIFNGLSYLSHTVFRPVLVLGNNVGGKLAGLSSYFTSKSSLYFENENLKSELEKSNARMANHDSLLSENTSLKEILGRKNANISLFLAGRLSRPSHSLYDTLIIDAGALQGIKPEDLVFALGNVPVGRISSVYPNSSKVILFTNPGEKTKVIVGEQNLSLETVGRGGGNFEIILPRDFTPAKGDEVVLPGVTLYVLGIVETIISDPRDPFIKALLVSPVNIQEQKFVEVQR